ncbi:HPr-rel-A system PqqD family peptide chaperone [Methylomonas subterranea]|uniref:HPr-rel-A system PqqD family peptide chaperone n=1 Tax=Methylomonas subterranea TaxID=2952225 RepID=UPI0035321C3B
MIARFIKIAQILVAKWDDELVVYNPRSGDTHLFPVVLEPVIRYCSKYDDISLSELLSDIDVSFPRSSNESERIVVEVIKQLVNIGFLQPVTSD